KPYVAAIHAASRAGTSSRQAESRLTSSRIPQKRLRKVMRQRNGKEFVGRNRAGGRCVGQIRCEAATPTHQRRDNDSQDPDCNSVLLQRSNWLADGSVHRPAVVSKPLQGIRPFGIWRCCELSRTRRNRV